MKITILFILFTLTSWVSANDRVQGHLHLAENGFLQSLSVYRHLPQKLFEPTEFFNDERTKSNDIIDERTKREERQRISDLRWSLGYGAAWRRTPEAVGGGYLLPELTDLTHLFRVGLGIEAAFPWDFTFALAYDAIPARYYSGGEVRIGASYAIALGEVVEEIKNRGKPAPEQDPRLGEVKKRFSTLKDPSLVIGIEFGVGKDSKSVSGSSPTADDRGTDGVIPSKTIEVPTQVTELSLLFALNPAFANRTVVTWHTYHEEVGSPLEFMRAIRTARAEYAGLEGPVPLYRGFPRYELQTSFFFYFDQVWEFDLGGGLMRPWVDDLPYQYFINPLINRLFGDRWLIGAGANFRIQDTHPYIGRPSAMGTLQVSYFF